VGQYVVGVAALFFAFGAKLGFRASGCNIARRCAVEEARRKHGKRRMTNAEKEEERKQARQRGHSVSTADAHY
jgi:hypothetical protein